jgi:hypothetical protein
MVADTLDWLDRQARDMIAHCKHCSLTRSRRSEADIRCFNSFIEFESFKKLEQLQT